MMIPPDLLAPGVFWWLSGAHLLALIWALAATPWGELQAVPARLHLVLGSSAFLVLLWWATLSSERELRTFLMGVTAVTLLVGGGLALLSATLAQLLMILSGLLDPQLVLANSLLNVTLPVLITLLALRGLRPHLADTPKTLLCAASFLGGAVGILFVYLSMLTLLMMGGEQVVMLRWRPEALPLVMVPEGLINAALVALLAVWAPHWIRALDEPRPGAR